MTPHAVRRYIERIRPGLTYHQALGRIIRDMERAHFVRRQENGELWRGPKPHRVRYILGPGDGDKPAVLTVVAPHDRWKTKGK